MDPPEIRYAWNGEISLAFQLVGAGPVDLVYLPSSTIGASGAAITASGSRGR